MQTMSNYYQTKFDLELREGSHHAFKKTVKILLYQTTPPKLPNQTNKFQHFWQADFVQNISMEQLRHENYRLAFSQYIRYGNINLDLCGHIAQICPESFVMSVRQSGVIHQWNYNDWEKLAEFCHQSPHIELRNFIAVAEKMREQYQQRLQQYNELKAKLNLSQTAAMLYGSLYTYEYLLPEMGQEAVHIPYQIDTECDVNTENLWQAFDKIIEQTPPSRKPITEKYFALLFRNKLMPFLTGEGLIPLLILEYEQYKQMVALRVELDLYQNFVFYSYCYQPETQYSLHDGNLILHSSKEHNPDNFNRKFSILNNYWLWRGGKESMETPYIFRMKPKSGNLGALAKAQGIVLCLQEVFGIYEHISNKQQFDLFESILTITLSQAFYRQSFLDEFNQHRQQGVPARQALFLLSTNGIMSGENRFPISFSEIERKAERMSDWIISGSKTAKKKKMAAILKFWSQDLRHMRKDAYAELPYYQSDDVVIELPHRFGLQNLHTTTVNHFRRLQKNRAELRHETAQMEVQLADLFKKYGWQVWLQHQPSESAVGEIDLIVVADNRVLVVELKSSFIKKTIKEIYEYKYFVLNKAAYQLKRRMEYVQNVWLSENGFSSEQMSVHAWIVDTTLEFDHEKIQGFLKVSLEELLISLNQHTDFQKHLFDFDTIQNNLPLVFSKFIEDIEENQFWQKTLVHFDEMDNDWKHQAQHID